MPELGQVSDRIAAALVGAAPYDDDSGAAGRTPHQGRSALGPKRSLHALPRRRHAEQSRPQGLLSTSDCQGKAPKVALVACMRKLIIILNTMIARRQKWDPSRYAVS